MKAVRIEQYGGAEVLQLQDIPVPEPGQGEVRVRIAHAGVNVMDVGTRKGLFAASQTYPVRLPTTIGMEGAGVVEKIDAGVAEFAPGDRVAYCLVWNSHAEFAVVPAWQLAPVPHSVSLALAAAATFQGFTAHYLATDVAYLGPGRSCLVHAAAGGVGQLLVGFAASLGATVYGTVRSEHQKQSARDRGAREVFLSGEGGFVAPLLEMTGGAGVDVVFDSVGALTLRDDFRVARKKGLVVSFGVSSGAVDDLNPAELGEAGSLYLTRPRLKDHLPDGDTIRRRAAALYAGLADGSLVLPVGKHYAMEDVADAHAAVEARTAKGKPLLDVGDLS